MKILFLLFLSVTLSFAQSAGKLKAKGDKLEAAGKTEDALIAYQEAEKQFPEDTETLIKIAKQYCDMISKLDPAAAKFASDSAVEYSRRAVTMSPEMPLSHIALALSLSKHIAYLTDVEKIRVAREIKASAEKALSLDPESDNAHHILGRWHQEIARIDIASRVAAQFSYGDLPQGSFEDALKHFGKARELKAERAIHQLEYGNTLAMMGRKVEAKREIQKGLEMEDIEVDFSDSRSRAKVALKSL